MIKTENIFKSYNNGKTEVIKGVSLSVNDGEFTVILGASGSGKSTLLNILSGLEKADSGKVTASEQVISDMNEKQLTEFRKNNVGFVFQQYYLLPHLNVENNIKMGANLAKNSEWKQIAAALGLSEKLKKRPSELSGGEQQRVCIARALAKQPRILFLDEPTGALDESTGREVLNYIMELKKSLDFTIIMVTHNQNIADMAQTVIKLNSGKIVEVKHNETQKSAYEIGW